MAKILVAGYGVIGQRLADGVAAQADMELIGVVDAAPTFTVRTLRDKGITFKLLDLAFEEDVVRQRAA